MSEERRQILNLLADGKISVAEAEGLLQAVERPAGTEPAAAARGKPKYLRVVVEPSGAAEGAGGERVNIRVPLQLLRAGLKLAPLLPEAARVKLDGALRGKGIHLELPSGKGGAIEQLIEHLADFEVNVDDKGQRVRVFCE